MKGWLLSMLVLCLPLMAADLGKEALGRVEVIVYFATDADPARAGAKATAVRAATIQQLRDHDALRFDHYRLLGADRQQVYRSYENWAQPIAGSDEILCRFETEGRMAPDTIRLDLELWLSRKKTLKSGLALTHGKPVLVLGPAWRGGRLIISMQLIPTTPESP